DGHRAGAVNHRYRNAHAACAHDIAGDGEVAQILAPAGGDAGGVGVLDHVAGDGGVGLDGDAEALGVRRLIGAAGAQVAHQIAAHAGEPAALLKVGHRYAGGRLVDHVVGDN